MLLFWFEIKNSFVHNNDFDLLFYQCLALAQKMLLKKFKLFLF